ncbi:MAG: radical SAM protein [Sphaerochaeta sp.]
MCSKEGLQSKLPLHKVLPFANVDGLGNRTSIFVQGCDIRCLYCHNPETQDVKYKEREVSIEDLLKEIEPYTPYVRGITVSGGEPTLYHKQLEVLFDELHKQNLTCYVDSNGYFDRDKIASLIEVTDKFLFDVKTLDNSGDLIGVNKTGNLDNLKYLLELGKVEEVRHVALTSFVDSENVVRQISEILKDYPEVLFRIIKVHTRGCMHEDLIKDKVPSNRFMGNLGKMASDIGVKLVRVQL